MSKRITIAIPSTLVTGLDAEVAAGAADNRTDLINEAIGRELARRERAAIDAAIYALADDPEYQALDAQLTAEFERSDQEVWAMLDEDFGPEPPESDG